MPPLEPDDDLSSPAGPQTPKTPVAPEPSPPKTPQPTLPLEPPIIRPASPATPTTAETSSDLLQSVQSADKPGPRANPAVQALLGTSRRQHVTRQISQPNPLLAQSSEAVIIENSRDTPGLSNISSGELSLLREDLRLFGRRRSLSTGDLVQTAQEVPTHQEEMFQKKDQCDKALLLIAATLTEIMGKSVSPAHQTALQALLSICDEIGLQPVTSLSVRLMTEAIDKARRVQLAWDPAWPGGALATRILMALSPMLRMIAINAALDDTRRQFLSGLAEDTAAASNILLRPRETQADSALRGETSHDDAILGRGSEYETRIASYLSEKLSTWNEWLAQSKIERQEETAVCRICEENIFVRNFQHHSKWCGVHSQCTVKLDTINEKLVKCLAQLEKFETEGRKVDSQISIVNSALDSQLTSTACRALAEQINGKAVFQAMPLSSLANVPTSFSSSSPSLTTSPVTDTPASVLVRLQKLLALKADVLSEYEEASAFLQAAPPPHSPSGSFTPVARNRGGLNGISPITTSGLVESQESPDRATFTPTGLSSGQTTPGPRVSAMKMRPSIHDFELIKLINRGAYGRVYLARKKKTGDYYAVKVLKKDVMRAKNQMSRVRSEHRILATAHSDFVVKMLYSFEDHAHFFLVMEYIQGGDLGSLLHNLICVEEPQARMYAAEIVLAIGHLHSKGIIHRDLKPDNLLISMDGHIKLTDFGLSRFGAMELQARNIDPAVQSSAPQLAPQSRTNQEPLVPVSAIPQASPISSPNTQVRVRRSSLPYASPSSGPRVLTALTTEPPAPQVERNTSPPSPDSPTSSKSSSDDPTCIGTPDYMAPELVLGLGHGPEVDWWALGIIIYEMLVGVPPFQDATPQDVFANILNHVVEWPEPPNELSEEAVDLITRLLMPDPKKRLGAGPKGFEDIQKHPFFAGIEWSTLIAQPAIFVPRPSDDADTSYFDTRQEDTPDGEDADLALILSESVPVEPVSASDDLPSARSQAKTPAPGQADLTTPLVSPATHRAGGSNTRPQTPQAHASPHTPRSAGAEKHGYDFTFVNVKELEQRNRLLESVRALGSTNGRPKSLLIEQHHASGISSPRPRSPRAFSISTPRASPPRLT
eukprot:TRINITY_DN2412_c1_g1_i1.p1 TRINITY_DN2412_c1_g1~~TRINITY_DN2412_c1_g1_i1.p1  ORF type:complete len:1279 (+),score=181.61 TRINITY_DN2412_c1_g1_i1:509-3838(+)